MHCPYCGLVLDDAAPVSFELYKRSMGGPLYIVTCEQGGEKHHVLLSEWGVGAYRPHPKPRVTRIVTPSQARLSGDDLISPCISDTPLVR